MNKKPPELPNIEDATLRACLAPLMETMNAGGELASQGSAPVPVAPVPVAPARVAQARVAQARVAQAREAQARVVGAARPQIAASGSNDNPLPAADKIDQVDREPTCTPKTLAEWRLQADDDFAAFRMVELFLAMTDVELVAAAAEFPRQIAGTVARIGRIKQRLAAQYDRVTTAVALLERAQLQASASGETD